MLPFRHTCLKKPSRLNLKASTPLGTGYRRCPTAACGSLSLTGFTLVELLIALSIFSVVSIGIYSTFSSGMSVLRRVKNIDFSRQKVMLKSERIARQLRELPACRKQLFMGTATRLSLPEFADYLPCRVTYHYDSAKHSLMRTVDQLNDIISKEGKIILELKSKSLVFLPKIKEVKFSYLYLNLKTNTYDWVDAWAQDYLPLAVKISIFGEKQEYATTVFLPTA